jgi:predicted amino acid racemase
MTAPRIEIDLGKIRHNTRFLVQRLEARGIKAVGVTKAVCGHPDVANAMLAGGAKGLADSRIENVERMRNAGISCPVTMIRTPMLSQAERVSASCGTSYNTEIEVIALLGVIAHRKGTVHGVVAMVEMGDHRDGVMPGDLEDFAAQILDLPGVALKGIAANFSCLSGADPDCQDMAALSTLANDIESACGPYLETVSGGNSANLSWAFGPSAPGRINELRLGEAILLGIDPVSGTKITGLHGDAFVLVAEVIETKAKPVHMGWPRKLGECKTLQIVANSQWKSNSIIAIGTQDTDISGLEFPTGVVLNGASSDHTVIETVDQPLQVGSEIKLRPNYNALMRIMNAADIAKVTFDNLPVSEMKFAKKNQPSLAIVRDDGARP